MNLNPVIRQIEGSLFKTDENNLIVDVDILGWQNLEILNRELIAIPGVVETGLFLDLADVIIYARKEETVVLEKQRNETS